MAGSYLIYCSSKKMKAAHNAGDTFLKAIPVEYLKPVGMIILLISATLTMKEQGVEAGAFAFIVYLMGSFSLVNLLLPYKELKWFHLLALFMVAIGIELLSGNLKL